MTGTGGLVRVRVNLNTTKYKRMYFMKTWSRTCRTSEWAEGLPSNRIITLSTDTQEARDCVDDDVKLDQQPPGAKPENTRLTDQTRSRGLTLKTRTNRQDLDRNWMTVKTIVSLQKRSSCMRLQM